LRLAGRCLILIRGNIANSLRLRRKCGTAELADERPNYYNRLV
jgi:hypothetical protein